MKKIFGLLIISVLAISFGYAQKSKNKNGLKPLDSLTKKMIQKGAHYNLSQ